MCAKIIYLMAKKILKIDDFDYDVGKKKKRNP